jgi:hypothetical protein
MWPGTRLSYADGSALRLLDAALDRQASERLGAAIGLDQRVLNVEPAATAGWRYGTFRARGLIVNRESGECRRLHHP